MPEAKKLLFFSLSLIISVLAMTVTVLAEQRYVIDTIVVSLREGPGTQYKSVKTVQTGQSLEVLESKDNFLKVRTSEGDVGWIPNQYAASEQTKTTQVQELQDKIHSLSAENEKLSAQLAVKETLPASKGEEFSGLKKLQSKLDSMTEQYNSLEADAKGVLPIREENARLKRELAALQATTAQLQEDKKSLSLRKNLYWFLAGAGVFLLGWIIGKIPPRRQRPSLTL